MKKIFKTKEWWKSKFSFKKKDNENEEIKMKVIDDEIKEEKLWEKILWYVSLPFRLIVFLVGIILYAIWKIVIFPFKLLYLLFLLIFCWDI